MMTIAIQQPFSNIQLELLKLYSRNIPDNDLMQIRLFLACYFSEKVTDETLPIEVEKLDKVEMSLKVDDLLKTLNRPIKKTLDIDALKKAKNYKGVNRERFNRLIKEINITEPIELLISQLNQ
jgi:hypothetical protein